MEEILESQMNSLKIKQFLDSAQKFTNEAFPDLNVSEMFKSSLTGNLNNVSILNYFAKIFSEELMIAINLISSVLIIIVIHSIFKTIIESLENSSASQIVYTLCWHCYRQRLSERGRQHLRRPCGFSPYGLKAQSSV